MAFAIEVPGEAVPLSPEQVYLALQSAGSSHQLQIQTGTQQLQAWETQRGYYTLLQAVFLDKSLPSEVRYLAIIQLKNGIDKYWRKAAINALSKEEKAEIRSHLIQGGLDEPNASLALQNALVVSKVVRVEYPLDWPDVLQNLIKVLRTAHQSNQLQLRRGMMIMLQVIKELSTARLRSSQTSLQSITPEIVFLLNEIYTEKVAYWMAFLNGNGDDEGGAMDAMENSLYALKTLRRLLIVGYEYPNHSSDVQQFWELSQHQFGQFLEMVTHEPPALFSPAKEIVEKHLAQFSKLHVQMSSIHPAAFALLPSSLELVRAYWGLAAKFGEFYGSETQDFNAKSLENDDSKDKRPVMEKLCLKGLTLIRACIKMVFQPAQSFKYKTAEVKAEQAEGVALIKSQLLTDELVSQMASVIVSKFFIFRQADLNAWEEDQDEWEIKEEGTGDGWEFEVRPCAEKLFMDLVLNFKKLLFDSLLSFFQQAAKTNEASVVTKDAVYTAMGLSASMIFQSFDFNSFLESTLVNDVQQTGPGCKVLRRRLAILIGQWVPISISEQNRVLVYQMFLHMLNPEDEINDYVVRVTAARQLKNAIDDTMFGVENFVPYAANTLARLIGLVQEVENTDTKMAILDTIRIIAVRMEEHIEPFADQIVSVLPHLWESSGEEHLLKQAILTLICTLVSSMGEKSQRYNSLVLPFIQGAVAPGSEMQIYLLEEALDLWSTILGQAPQPASTEVLTLIESLFSLLEIGSDNLRVVLSIVDSYVSLAPQAMLADAIRPRLMGCMANLLGTKRREMAGQVTTIVENMIRAAAEFGGDSGVALIARDLYDCGYTEKIFAGLRDAWEAHQTTGPSRRYPKLDDVVETDYFTILARFSLSDPNVLISIMSSVGDAAEIWRWLSTEWFRHFDSMANIDHQKLSCLALTRLLELPLPMMSIILERLQDYFAMWTSVISEMMTGRDDLGDNLIWQVGELTATEGESPEIYRKRLHGYKDPVHSVHTFVFVKEILSKVVAACGGEEAFQREFASNVDKDVLLGFQNLGTQVNNDPQAFWQT
ncbi:armadillo-type protein [Tricladium varicosporioides]|nr:armadillo-type protein [Hymenoscyphus varicosporioides]